MKILTVKAPAKINLFLKVGDLLPNGYHEISTLMQTVDLCDELTFEEIGQQPAYFMDDCPAGPENLMVRAAEAFYSKLGRRPQVSIFLQKQIPFSAGLGGGSTDAAAVLRGLNTLHGNPLEPIDLFELAKTLGADVPFCLQGGRCLAAGVGEQLTVLPQPEQYAVWLQKNHAKSSTGGMYALVDELPHDLATGRLIGRLLKSGRETTAFTLCENDFLAVSPDRAEQWQAMNRLYARGALLAGLSGSGPTVFGLFPLNTNLAKIGLPEQTGVWHTKTISQLPAPVWLHK